MLAAETEQPLAIMKKATVTETPYRHLPVVSTRNDDRLVSQRIRAKQETIRATSNDELCSRQVHCGATLSLLVCSRICCTNRPLFMSLVFPEVYVTHSNIV